MKKPFILTIAIILFSLLITSCGNESSDIQEVTHEITEIKDTVPTEQNLYAWVNSLNVREAPSLDSKTIIKLKENATVIYKGKESENTITSNLRGKKYTSTFKHITTESGLQGWAFGAALKPLVEKKKLDKTIAPIFLDDKIFTIEESIFNKLWLNEMEIITSEKIIAIFEGEEIGILTNASEKKHSIKSEEETLFEVFYTIDEKQNQHIKSVRIESTLIADQYGVYPGLTYEQVKKQRPNITQSTTSEGKTMAYQAKSNLMYEFESDEEGKTQYSEQEMKERVLKAIIWKENE